VRFALGFAFFVAGLGPVWAGDEADSHDTFFGGIGVGGRYSSWQFYVTTFDGFETTSELYRTPILEAQAKIGIQPKSSRLGAQFDLDYDYFSNAWISPAVLSDGFSTSVTATGHTTFLANESLKLGTYFGVSQSQSRSNTDFYSVKYRSSALIYGVEGLYVLSPSTWVEAHIGARDFISSKFFVSFDDGSAFSDSFKDSENKVLAYDVGAAVHHRFSPSWSGSAGLNFAQLNSFDFTRRTLEIGAGAEYDFQSVPLKLSSSVIYSYADFEDFGSGVPHDVVTARAKLTWSFGDRGTGAAGKLFAGNQMLSNSN
jgi:hypothetical protein